MKILIIRLSAIGDIVMASGILNCLKKSFKDISIDWLVQKEYKELLTATDLITDTIEWDRKGWDLLIKRGKILFFWKEFLGFLKRLREKEYDVIIDLQGLWKSTICSLMAKGKKRIFLNPKEYPRWLLKEVIISPKSKEISSEYKFLLKKINAYKGEYSIGIKVSEEDMEKAKLKLNNMGVLEKKYIVFSPFTTRPQKMWPLRYWYELAKKINTNIIILGGNDGKAFGEELEKKRSNVLNLAGKTTIRESMYIVQNSSFFIGVDTGLTHMAMLSKIPAIAIFGATCPYLYTDNPKGIVLYNKLACSPCKRRPICNSKYPCMKMISPDMVYRTYKDLV